MYVYILYIYIYIYIYIHVCVCICMYLPQLPASCARYAAPPSSPEALLPLVSLLLQITSINHYT